MFAQLWIFVGVDQQKVIKKRVKPVPFKLGHMVNQWAISAQFLNENTIAQPLGCHQIQIICGQTHLKIWVGHSHAHRSFRSAHRAILPNNL